MNVQEMIDMLALRLEDPQKAKFPDKLKHLTLSNSQVLVANLAANEYLTQLEVLDTNESATSGVIALSGLTYKPLRGTEGIQNVKNYSGLYCTMLNWNDLKKTENSILAGSTKNPLAWLFSEAIRLMPTSLTAADVYYRKQPTPLLFANTTYAPSEGAFFIYDDVNDYGYSTVDDYYKGAVIYFLNDNSYHIITGYTGETKVVEYSPSGTPATAGFYFIPTDKHDFHLTYLEGVTCDLDSQLHNAVVYLAEAECWAMANEMDRATGALQKGIDEISALNAIVEQVKGVGVSR